MDSGQHELFMRKAIELSRRAAIIEKSGGVFGAVIVKDGQIISEGYNLLSPEHILACNMLGHSARTTEGDGVKELLHYLLDLLGRPLVLPMGMQIEGLPEGLPRLYERQGQGRL